MTTDQTADRTSAFYDAIDAFQRTHRLPGLQHAQIRGLLAEHLARTLPAVSAPVQPSRADVERAAWVDGDPLMEAIAAAVWEHCQTDGTMSLVVDDPRNIAAVAAAVARAAASAVVAPPTDRATLSDRLARAVAEDASALRMDLYDDLATFARQTGNDHLTEFLFEGLLRRAADEEQPAKPDRCPHGCDTSTCPCLACEADEEQPATEARPPQHSWRVETLDPLPNEWVPGSHFLNRQAAVERYETANRTAPLWKDGTPVQRRIVRETTTYTVEPAPPA